MWMGSGKVSLLNLRNAEVQLFLLYLPPQHTERVPVWEVIEEQEMTNVSPCLRPKR